MPNRILREGVLSSARYHALHEGARAAFVELVLIADDYGLIELSPTVLRMRCPFAMGRNDDAVSRVLSDLADADLVRLYQVDGRLFGYVPRFGNWPRAIKPRYPLPPGPVGGDEIAALIARRQGRARRPGADDGGDDAGGDAGGDARAGCNADAMQVHSRCNADAHQTETVTETVTETEKKKTSRRAPAARAARGARVVVEGKAKSEGESLARTRVFAVGVPLLMAARIGEKRAGSFLGAQIAEFGAQAVDAALREASAARPDDLVGWIVARLAKSRPVDFAAIAADARAHLARRDGGEHGG